MNRLLSRLSYDNINRTDNFSSISEKERREILDNLDNFTVKQLKEIARNCLISGRSRMNKADLQDAINYHYTNDQRNPEIMNDIVDYGVNYLKNRAGNFLQNVFD